MSPGAARASALALLATVAGCGPTFVAVRPSEAVTAAAPGVRAQVQRIFLTEEARESGLDDGARFVVELRVRNEGQTTRRISPGSFSCLMELDARSPGETRGLLPAGGGEGPFPGQPPDEGSVLLGITIPPGEEREVWAIFHGYRFEGSDLPRRITLKIPLEDGPPLALVLADPARGALRWETRPARSAFVVGIRSGALLGGALQAQSLSTELSGLWRVGPLRLDVGLVSSLLVQTRGPLVSETSAFSGTGLSAHLAGPLLRWGPAQNPYEFGVYAGGAATILLEIPKRVPDEMTPLHTNSLFAAEAGLELAGGALRFASTPFPLSPTSRPLPRWSIRAGYVQSWVARVTSGGYATTLRLVW